MTLLRISAVFCFTPVLFAAEEISWSKDVRPLLAERCGMCHSASNASGHLSVADAVAVLKGGASGPSVIPGQPDKSLLLQYVSGPKPKMPKFGKPLTNEQVVTLTRWIEQGARADSSAPLETTWWSLKPLHRPTLPLKSSWQHTPVDAFIEQLLQANHLSPSLEADRRTLIRRVYFDLHGLPPTPAEVQAFIADKSADAYERLVDRLLESPRYGERWARHWLDVVHYGDSHGYDKDKPRNNAWPYRDYVIRAFNEDKPYPLFVREQLAADVLYPDDTQALAATGFLAAGPWDFVGHQELREGTTDKQNTRLLDRDDIVTTTISTFTSMTAHCARCHNHKFDPIPQQDYYNLQSIFAGIDRADRPFDDDPALNRKRQQLLEQKRHVQMRLQPLLDKVELASSPEITDLDSSIQDAKLQIVHLGKPENPADVELKDKLEKRVVVDRERRQKLIDQLVGPETYAATERVQSEMSTIDAQLKVLPAPRWLYSGTNYFQKTGTFRPALEPRPIFVLNRGSVQNPGNPARPGALSCISVPFEIADTANEGARRAALAKWITHPDNVLTWRSIVNRVWQYHFGTGLVDTPSDFGHMGSLPSHPELLDWLAVWFRDDAHGSLKQLHRMLVTSAVYRQASTNRSDAAKLDSENRLLWRMNRTRIDAEAVRDATLAVAGKLDLTAGGPGVRWFYFRDDHSPVYDYSRFDPDAPGAYRRSIYRFIVRSVPDPFMERLDCPDPSILTPKRSVTLTAIQALAMLNNPFVIRMSEHWAQRLQSQSNTPDGQIRLATELAFGREPSDSERSAYRDYIAAHGLRNFCRVLLNTNEFLFVD